MERTFSLLSEFMHSRSPDDIIRALKFGRLKGKDELLWKSTNEQEKEAMLLRGVDLTKKMVGIMDQQIDWFALFGIMSAEEKADMRRFLNIVQPKVDKYKSYFTQGRFVARDVWITAPFTQEEIVRMEDPDMVQFGDFTSDKPQEEKVAHITFSQSRKHKGLFYPASFNPCFRSGRLFFIYPFIDGKYDFFRVPEDEVFGESLNNEKIFKYDQRTNRLTIRENQFIGAPFKVQISDLPFELGLFFNGKTNNPLGKSKFPTSSPKRAYGTEF